MAVAVIYNCHASEIILNWLLRFRRMTTSFADVNRIFGIVAGYIDFVCLQMAVTAIRHLAVTMATIQDIFGAILTDFRWIAYLQKRR